MKQLIPIKPIGDFFPKDDNGFIINPASPEKISLHWNPIIQRIKNAYLEEYGAQIHSIYLRGSLVRGFSVDGFSDLDVLALIHQKDIRWKSANCQRAVQKELQQKFPFVKEIEMMVSSFHENFHSINPRLSMVIKTQAICIYGMDIIPSLPKFRPGKEMMLNYRWLEESVLSFLQKDDFSTHESQDITKIILRSGFELVMENSNNFTTDLFFCYREFSKYYPSKEKEMQQALFWYLNPPKNKAEIRPFLEDFGKWLIEMVKEKLSL